MAVRLLAFGLNHIGLLTRCEAAAFGAKMFFVLFSLFATSLLLMAEMGQAKETVHIGLAEDVILLPWGIKLPARVDTGAATTSLDARELKIEGDIAVFKLPEKYGGLQLRLPVVDWKYVRSAERREKRPIVEMECCIGPKHLRIRVNLNDRSMVKYPIIIGRNVLKGNFVVDCMKSHCLPPSCPEVTPK